MGDETGQYHLVNWSDNIDHIQFQMKVFILSAFLNKIFPQVTKILQKVANSLENSY